MTISILTLFPQQLLPILSCSIIGKAQKHGLVKVRFINIRDFALDKHKTVDDKPYGGGPGMILKVNIVERAIRSSRLKIRKKFKERVILLDPKGKVFTQKKARRLASFDHLILVCGHYEGIDARINYFVDEAISIGQYILTGGEIPALVITDAVVRLIPNVLPNKSVIDESFSLGNNALEAPQYTRPRIYKGKSVPKVLLSGNHQKILNWRKLYPKKLID